MDGRVKVGVQTVRRARGLDARGAAGGSTPKPSVQITRVGGGVGWSGVGWGVIGDAAMAMAFSTKPALPMAAAAAWHPNVDAGLINPCY